MEEMMIKREVILEIVECENLDRIVFNIVFPDTGEIRQKRVSRQWLLNRIFQSEIKTWKKNHQEVLEIDKVVIN